MPVIDKYLCNSFEFDQIISIFYTLKGFVCFVCLIVFLTAAVLVVEPECEKSSATTYFWYRQTLNITSTIDDTGGLNWKMTLSLLVAWILVCLAVIKGIQSSGKVRGQIIVKINPSAFCPTPQQDNIKLNPFNKSFPFSFLISGSSLTGRLLLTLLFRVKVKC